jgi:cyclase
MAKPRMCFTLLYADGNFCLSRNFNLQAVGDYAWLMENYEFESIARSIDELIILNVSRSPHSWEQFVQTVRMIVELCFMPVSVGGGIRTGTQARVLFENGADKIVLNSAFFTDTKFVESLARSYGSQSIVSSLDFRRNNSGEAEIFIECGRLNTGVLLSDAISLVSSSGAGEIYLNSIDRDGTGMGFDLAALEVAFRACDLPIIAAGGAETSDRLAEGILSGFTSGVATAHLFNFMCDGLGDAREKLIAQGIPLSQWNFEDLKSC